MKNTGIGILAGVCGMVLSMSAMAQDDRYVDVRDDLTRVTDLQEVSDRAYNNAEDYWELTHGHERDGHDHEEHGPDQHDGTDEELSAGEAVTEIYTVAMSMDGGVAPAALDIVSVTKAVVDSWPDCQDTFDAVRAAVELTPDRADEIVANIAVKRDCNCSNGGLWLDQRVEERIRVQARHAILDVPIQCSCSQVAMYAGISGLPENRLFDPDMPDLEKTALINSMTEKVQMITDRTASMQSKNDWECGCTDINIASSMQGIEEEELRDGAYDGLAARYAEETGDRGMVVDSFGIVGTHPEQHWGSASHATRDNVLRRETVVYRGDNLIMDPFDPAAEYTAHGDGNHEHVGQHAHTSGNTPTDLFISEYIEGWNEAAMQQAAQDRDPEQRNRVVELYNGSEETIDMGKDQYFLEIYAGPGPTSTIVTPPMLVKKTISLGSDVTFEFDKSDIKAEASEDLQEVVQALNDADIFSEILISGYTCDMGSEAYNLALSERRADSVKSFLQQSGLKDVTIRTEGLGEAQPRLPNTSPANRARNRRVDITFVTKDDAEIEATVAEGDDGGPRRTEYTFLVPIPASVHEVESSPTNSMAAGEYAEGDMDPRQVIGLNGAVEPGATWVIAYSESDDNLKDAAQEVTSQLDFKSNETLVIRRVGGEKSQYCRVQAYSFVTNYPAVPFVRYPGVDPVFPPADDDVASPN